MKLEVLNEVLGKLTGQKSAYRIRQLISSKMTWGIEIGR